MRLGKRRYQRGSALMIAMAVMFLILTIIMVAFTTGSVTRQSLLRAHDELVLRQKMQFEMAWAALGNEAPVVPKWLDVEVDLSIDRSLLQTANVVNDLAKGLPNLNQGRDLGNGVTGYPGYRYVQYKLPTGSQRLGVISEGLPYAVMAFAGGTREPSVSFEAVQPWLNPALGDSARPDQAYSGTAPFILANGRAEIKNFPYGFLYHAGFLGAPVQLGGQGGTAAVALASDGNYNGVAAVDPVPYRNLLSRQVATFMSAARDRAAATNPSAMLHERVNADDTLGLFFSGAAVTSAMRERLSIQGAQNFWLPSIPGFKKQLGIMYTVIFHIPSPPDGNLGEVAQKARSVMATFMKAIEALDKAIEALDVAIDKLEDARKWVDDLCDCSWSSPWCCIAKYPAEAALEVAKLAVIGAKVAVGVAETAVMIIITPINTTLTEVLLLSGWIEGQTPIPASRQGEQEWVKSGYRMDEKGCDYWAYNQAFSGLVKFVGSLFAGDLDSVRKALGDEVSVTLFGQYGKEQEWDFGDRKATTRASWNVPAGRTFYYDRSLEIRGDLWVGRGASLVVAGDLTMAAGGPYGNGSDASGVVVLEEGATLVVEGRFQGAGNPQSGSIMVGGPMGALHGLTGGLLARGDVILPHGVVPGVGADQLKSIAADGRPSQELAPLSSRFFRQLLNEVAPNLAKVDGPFHARLPYIARYATAFEWIIPLEIPFVIPQNIPNMNVEVFRGLSYIYAPTLNAELGENLLTHADWWGKGGEGKAPVLAKPAAVELAKKNGPNAYTLSVAPDAAKAAVARRLKLVGTNQMDDFANKLLLTTMSGWITLVTDPSPIPATSYGTLLSKLMEKIANQTYKLEQRKKDLQDTAPKEVDTLTRSMTDFWTQAQRAESRADYGRKSILQECSGALVYSGGELTVGSRNGMGERTPLACGFFLAQGKITLEAQDTVGAAVSLQGTVRGQRLLYYPAFTQASLALPKTANAAWRTRTADTTYNETPDSAYPIGLWRPRLASEVRGGL